MSKTQKLSLLLLRLSFGFFFFYAGISKLFTPSWSAIGYLKSAKTFVFLYGWFAMPQNINWVNFINEWGLTLIGVALLLGIFVKYASFFGIFIMVLYYLPILNFPYVGQHSFVVDEHIIYILVFAVLYSFDAGKFWGLKDLFKRSPF